MPKLSNPLIDRYSPDRRPRRAAYALPTLFTAGNIFLGYLSILRSFRGAMLAAAGGAGAAEDFEIAAKAIGIAVLLDGLDGMIARLTHTTSDFGREMDSLADVISFGIAPTVLAFAWGVQFVDSGLPQQFQHQLFQAGYLIAFLFLLCGAARLARFNVQKNPIPKNPGRPNRKYFVGLPIPGAAGTVAASVVFLIMAAQYESWTLPFSVLLGVPIAVFGAFVTLYLRKLDNDVYAQIGLVMLIGLSAKNAILIVEFAKMEYDKGATLIDAALTGAKLRLRPILMTSFAFILGCVPLWRATGAGGISRQVLGTVVIGGMLAASFLAIFFIPVSFDVVERFGHWIGGGKKETPPGGTKGQTTGPQGAAHD